MKLLTEFDAPSYLAEAENECLTTPSGLLLWGSHLKNQIVGQFFSLQKVRAPMQNPGVDSGGHTS